MERPFIHINWYSLILRKLPFYPKQFTDSIKSQTKPHNIIQKCLKIATICMGPQKPQIYQANAERK